MYPIPAGKVESFCHDTTWTFKGLLGDWMSSSVHIYWNRGCRVMSVYDKIFLSWGGWVLSFILWALLDNVCTFIWALNKCFFVFQKYAGFGFKPCYGCDCSDNIHHYQHAFCPVSNNQGHGRFLSCEDHEFFCSILQQQVFAAQISRSHKTTTCELLM